MEIPRGVGVEVKVFKGKYEFRLPERLGVLTFES